MRANREAFTILELLTVLTIMLIVLSIAAIAAINWTRTTGMRAAAAALEAALIQARRHAVIFREPTTFIVSEAGATPAWFAVTNAAGLIGTTNFLRRGIDFAPLDETDRAATFLVRGNVAEGARRFVLTEPHRGTRALTATIEVYGVTGHTEVTR